MPRLKRPSPSMAVALVALFAALGGTAVAAKVIITHTSQIKNGAITRQDLAKSVINSGRIQDGSIRPDDLNGKLRSSAAADVREAVRPSGPDDVAEGASERVATLDLPAGSYVVLAKTTLTAPSQDNGILDPGDTLGGHCELTVGDENDEARALLGGPGANSPGTLNMQLTRTLGDNGQAVLECDVSSAPWRASDTTIIAIPAAGTDRQSVDG